VPAKPGARVTVQPNFNRLDLHVSGGLQDGRAAAEPSAGGTAWETASVEDPSTREDGRSRAARVRRAEALLNGEGRGTYLPKDAQKDAPAARSADAQAKGESAPATQANAPASSDPADAQAFAAGMNAAQNAQQSNAAANNNPSAAQTAQQPVMQGSSIVSAGNLIGVLSLAGLGVGLFVYRRRRGFEGAQQESGSTSTALVKAGKKSLAVKTGLSLKSKLTLKKKKETKEDEGASGERRRGGDRRMIDRGTPDRRQSVVKPEKVGMHQPQASEAGAEKSAAMPAPRGVASPASPSVLFGAYRIEQEVGKLAASEAHSIEVLASRASDDRRAVETSLIKVMRAPESGEDAKRRVRRALEEYGFMARQSAALLLAPDAYERASAARVLGEVQSSASLPFLLEALYDTESVVRLEVVSSLGALRLPRAIGPLIDMARRYPEMPADMLRPALNACSVETLELSLEHDADSYRPFAFSPSDFTGEIMGLEPPEAVEVLPEWLEDETLADALERLNSADVEARTLAAQSLAQFQVQRSVDALSAMASTDRSPVVRAAAVTSLGVVNHESVFSSVLMALADDAREVRAAAARALSRLSFNRADAYVRVIETSDAQTARDVARACVKAGLAAQAIDRLTSEDRRQAYESFALLALTVKSGEVGLALDAVANHPDTEVRMALLKLLLMMGRPLELLEPLRRLALRDRMPPRVRTTLVDAVARIEAAESGAPREADPQAANG
ncbi:MAG TPA: HEAT repeat domain-containing protein, partial [Pyrinomonadaceae bacterium]|nr:HEAT repeat domain-containing protein [Pyrinomonadaceae bacterium]